MTAPTGKQLKNGEGPWELVAEELIAPGKHGSTRHRLIVKDPETGKLYGCNYEQTTYDGQYFEDEAYEVVAVTKTITKYKRAR